MGIEKGGAKEIDEQWKEGRWGMALPHLFAGLGAMSGEN